MFSIVQLSFCVSRSLTLLNLKACVFKECTITLCFTADVERVKFVDSLCPTFGKTHPVKRSQIFADVLNLYSKDRDTVLSE